MKDYAKQQFNKRNQLEIYCYWFIKFAILIILVAGLWAILTIDYSQPIIVDLP